MSGGTDGAGVDAQDAPMIEPVEQEGEEKIFSTDADDGNGVEAQKESQTTMPEPIEDGFEKDIPTCDMGASAENPAESLTESDGQAKMPNPIEDGLEKDVAVDCPKEGSNDGQAERPEPIEDGFEKDVPVDCPKEGSNDGQAKMPEPVENGFEKDVPTCDKAPVAETPAKSLTETDGKASMPKPIEDGLENVVECSKEPATPDVGNGDGASGRAGEKMVGEESLIGDSKEEQNNATEEVTERMEAVQLSKPGDETPGESLTGGDAMSQAGRLVEAVKKEDETEAAIKETNQEEESSAKGKKKKDSRCSIS